MIKIKDISKTFSDHIILDHVSFEVQEQSTVAVIGSSGCGKSTLLRIIIGLETADTGQILVNDRPMEEFRSKIGMVFQSSALFDSLTVGENVAFALREASYPEDKIAGIVAEKLELVDLKGTENLMPSELSGGMQKRVSLARAIAHDPKIVLYDEPTTGLDPITSTAIEALINKLAKELKVTSIVVTHQLSTIYRTAQAIYLLDKGKLIAAGTPKEAEVHKNPIVSNFINAGKW